MAEIVTLARATSNAIRSHSFPVLEAGNISFPDGRYILDFEPGSDRASFVLTHRIEGAPLIARLLDEGKARYACAVSSPISSYRRTHLSRTARQQIQWDQQDLGEPPLFTPMIVSVVPCNLELDDQHDGVHRVWNGRSINLAAGSRLALGHVVQLRSSILQLLSLHASQELEDGEFLVDAETEQGFQFRVKLNPDLHAFLKTADREGVRAHIMTHIVTACLALLQRDFREDSEDEGGWRSHRNLSAFAEFLKGRNLPHWCDDEFRPESVATKLYPHALPERAEEEQS